MRRLIAFAPLLLATACLRGSGVSTAPAPSTTRRSDAEVRREVAHARLRLDSAARSGDPIALGEWFAADALVITEDDTLWGRNAIARWLVDLLPSGGVDVSLYPRRTEACIDGAYEYGGDYTVRKSNAEARPLETGGYALRWTRDAGGELRVQTLILHEPSAIAAGAARSEVRCTVSRVAAFDGRRFEVSVSPPHAGVWTWRGPDDLDGALQARGWRTYILRVPNGPVQAQPGPRLRDDLAVGAIAARWRVRPPWSVQAVTSFLPARAHMVAYSAERSADLMLTYEGYFAGALASWEWRRVRGGIGPALIRSTWRFQEERVYQLEDTEGDPIGWQSDGIAAVERWRTIDPALLAELGYTQPITGRVFADFAMHGRLFASSETRELPNLEPVRVDLGGVTFAISLGVAF